MSQGPPLRCRCPGLAAWALVAPSPPPEQIRRQVDDIFARPEFAPAAREPGWLLRHLAELFRWLGSLHNESAVLFWLILIGCLALLALLVGHIIYTLWRAFSYDAGGRRGAREAARRLRLSADLHAEALRRAEQGDYTEAVRHLFLSLVHRFDEAGRATLRKAATNHEYLDLLDPQLPVREELAVFVEALDEHWYGQRPADRPQFDHCLALYRRLAAV
jgi:hypothetical protein